jgi:hypothetical protein
MAVAQIQNLFFPTLFPSKKDEKASRISSYRKLSYAGISVGTTKFQTQALS